jgi:hypothetical protein
LKRRQKLCLNLLIKERIAQLIYGKPGKNRYKHNTPAKATQQTLATHLNYNPLYLNNSTKHLGETPQQNARGRHQRHKTNQTKRKRQETKDHQSSSRMRLFFGNILIVFAPKRLLLPDASSRAITHLLDFSLDCRPR